ncbi:MAG: hypothetical protein KBT19_06680 [Lachnospiraceae bacterium]|nr:hypothetical protein [Candidatus Colinaster equi]
MIIVIDDVVGNNTIIIIKREQIASSSLITLAGFYDVSVDYLLCLTENKHPVSSKVEELHLDDNAVELLI